jgi:hypothetical protein
MNEGIRYYESDYDNDRSGSVAVIKETVLSTIIHRPDLAVSYPEVLALTDTDLHISVNTAIAELKTSGLVTEELFVSNETNTVFQYYQLNWQVPETVEPSVSSRVNIKDVLLEFNKRIADRGVASLSAQEWCLRSIIEHAQRNIRSGEMTVPLAEIGWKMIHDLKDEGVEKWLVAYQDASAQAIELFQKHPDSE